MASSKYRWAELEIAGRQLAPVMEPLEVRLVGVGSTARALASRACSAGSSLSVERLGHLARHLALQRQDARQLPLVDLRPELRLVLHLDELRRDPDPGALRAARCPPAHSPPRARARSGRSASPPSCTASPRSARSRSTSPGAAFRAARSSPASNRPIGTPAPGRRRDWRTAAPPSGSTSHRRCPARAGGCARRRRRDRRG